MSDEWVAITPERAEVLGQGAYLVSAAASGDSSGKRGTAVYVWARDQGRTPHLKKTEDGGVVQWYEWRSGDIYSIPLDEILHAVELVVSDRGEGIWEEHMPTMFELWNQNRERAARLYPNDWDEEDA